MNRSTLILLFHEFRFQKTNLKIALNEPTLFLNSNAREGEQELTILNLRNPLSCRKPGSKVFVHEGLKYRKFNIVITFCIINQVHWILPFENSKKSQF